MTNVVQLRPPAPEPEPVWQCNCGNQWFFLHENGRIECSSCGVWARGHHWVDDDASPGAA